MGDVIPFTPKTSENSENQKNLRVIESELVPVYETDKGIKVVNGRELHQVLQSGQDFSTWVKKRLSECDATENVDYGLLHNSVEQVSGTKHRIDYIIKLETAKEMAMLERNEKGKQVRKYFIAVEKKYKQQVIDLDMLDPNTKLMNLLVQQISKSEIEQKRQAEQINRIEQKQAEIEQKQDFIVETFQNKNDTEDFQAWAKNCLSRIAESGNYRMDLSRNERHRAVTTESYVRLVKKTNCRLELLVANAKARALQNNPGIKKSELDKINKLYVIAHDKKLKIAYELVIKEMMVCYCVSME